LEGIDIFTGIVEETGEVVSLAREAGRARLTVRAKRVLEETRKGDSIAVNGACQTVEELSSETFSVWTLAESLKKTTLGALKPGDKVNLERALRADARLGGHIVQGHVSCAVPIVEIKKTPGNVYVTVTIPQTLRRYCVREGSVALDGISLTIAAFADGVLSVNIIPATFAGTALHCRRVGDALNFEPDILARYVESLLRDNSANNSTALSVERMKELGY
jgi:riboflavin synthase